MKEASPPRRSDDSTLIVVGDEGSGKRELVRRLATGSRGAGATSVGSGTDGAKFRVPIVYEYFFTGEEDAEGADEDELTREEIMAAPGAACVRKALIAAPAVAAAAVRPSAARRRARGGVIDFKRFKKNRIVAGSTRREQKARAYARRQECDALATRRAVFAREEQEERERERQFAAGDKQSSRGARQSKGRATKKKGARR